MRARGVLRALSAAGLAFAGLVGGHAVGYGIAIPDAHHRSTLIAQAGHDYLPSASWIAAVLGLAALGAGVVGGYVRRTPDRRDRLGGAAMAMMGVQALAFVLVEVFERLGAGTSLETLSSSLLIIGVIAQLVVGAVAALVLVGLRKVGAALRGDDPEIAVEQAQAVVPPEPIRVREMPALAANQVRGPPVALAA